MSWPTINLEQVCSFMTGGTPTSSIPEYYESGNIPWIVSGDIHKGEIFDCEKRITALGQKNSNAKPLLRNSVLIALNGQGKTRGTVALLRMSGATCNQSIVAMTPKDQLLPDYLYYYLKSQYQNIRNITGDKDRAGLNIPILKGIEIPLPPLSEQKRIAAILDKADAIRRKRQQAIQLADDFLRAVFLDMFGDPVTNPKGFKTRELGEFYIDEKNGTKCGPFGSALTKSEYVDSGIPVWNMDNITLKGGFIDAPSLWITKEKFKELEGYSVFPGDVIISRAGTVGKMGVVRSSSKHSIISTNLIRVRFGSGLLPEYFISLMTYCKGRVGRLKTGPDGAFTHMNTGVLDSLEFPYPPIELQQEYVDLQTKVKKAKSSAEIWSGNVDDLFVSLSQRAFSGEI